MCWKISSCQNVNRPLWKGCCLHETRLSVQPKGHLLLDNFWFRNIHFFGCKSHCVIIGGGSRQLNVIASMHIYALMIENDDYIGKEGHMQVNYSLAGMFWNWLTSTATLVYWWHQSYRGQTISTIYAAKPGNLLECYTGSFTPGLTQAHCFASTLPAYVHT